MAYTRRYNVIAPLTNLQTFSGQEITQFTYFQQAGGQALEIPSVEITYGLERIISILQVLPLKYTLSSSSFDSDWLMLIARLSRTLLLAPLYRRKGYFLSY